MATIVQVPVRDGSWRRGGVGAPCTRGGECWRPALRAPEGAIAAGCRVFAGYPITPATDIAEYMSKRLPQVDGYYMQCEDELAGMHACAGASLGGLKAMTATSGPGYTLMHDAYGWALTNEIPMVVVDAMRVSHQRHHGGARAGRVLRGALLHARPALRDHRALPSSGRSVLGSPSTPSTSLSATARR